MPELKRINVMGNTCSGKTTIAHRLSEFHGIPHVELDELYWRKDWTAASAEQFRSDVTRATEGEGWVVDGNYSLARDIVWERADTIVWLDLSLPVLMGRLTGRTLRRVTSGEELWNGNRESVRNALSRESLFLWAVKVQNLRRLQYPEWLTRPEYSHLTAVRLRSPAAVDRWLSSALAT